MLDEKLNPKKFETKVQFLKYSVLKQVAIHSWKGDLAQSVQDIPKEIVPGKKATMRCCVYKERAILKKRVKMALGGDRNNANVIEVIDIACDDCPSGGYEVVNACRGCIAQKCIEACKFGAITIGSDQRATIDKSKCKECGMCQSVCPYSAIIHHRRPCEKACSVKAISMNLDKSAHVDNEKCISCGACIYKCPFGAIMDKSYITGIIDAIKQSENNTLYNVYAVVAPALMGQFTYAKQGQVITGLLNLGFKQVFEAASGADMVADNEARELAEKGRLTSSCCPAFVEYIQKQFPTLKDFVSSNLSPMATISKRIKQFDSNCKIVFIGPCTAKKKEIKKQEVAPYVDFAMTFEELQALFDSRDIDITKLEQTELNDASYFGRIFARCGGLAEACQQSINEQNINFQVIPVVCSGIEDCKTILNQLQNGTLPNNFIEGMACVGGCVGGAGCITHNTASKTLVDLNSKSANKKSINESLNYIKEIDKQ